MAARVRTMSVAVISRKSMMKAPARAPAEPSSSRRSTPSGVMKARRRSRTLNALVAIRPPAQRQRVEIGEPADERRTPDQQAQIVVEDGLAADALEQAG